MDQKTPAEICEAVALDFKARKITHQQAGDAIGKSKAIISNQISGKKPFSKAMADLFAKAFGYNSKFLLYGEGDLRSNTVENPVLTINTQESTLDKAMLASLLEIAEYLLHLSGNQVAIDAWNSMMSGNYRGYKDKIELLMKQNKYNGRVPLIMARYITERIAEGFVPEGPATLQARADTDKFDLTKL